MLGIPEKYKGQAYILLCCTQITRIRKYERLVGFCAFCICSSAGARSTLCEEEGRSEAFTSCGKCGKGEGVG
jgi:hypothetical protein